MKIDQLRTILGSTALSGDSEVILEIEVDDHTSSAGETFSQMAKVTEVGISDTGQAIIRGSLSRKFD